MSNQTLRTAGVSAARDYQELPAWQKSIDLAQAVFEATESFASPELGSSIRAKAVEVASSIAAASGRNNEFGMNDSYSKAQSALAELATQLTLASRLGYIAADALTANLEEVSRLIVALKHGLKVAAKDADRAEREAKRNDDAHEERNTRPRREFKARDGGEDRPRREYKPRDGGEDRPRREFKPRDGGERKPYGDKKPYGEKKSYGDKKPYGNKKPYGDKKFGDKKPYGDRKPGGGKPFRKPRD